MGRLARLFCLSILVLSFQACGYTSKTVLPKGIQSIYVKTTLNKIPVGEVYAYQPGLEMDITNALIRRFHQDGNLRVLEESQADAILETHLTRFEQSGVRFDQLERVEEFRMFVVVAARLIHRESKEVIWEEANFSGDAEYFVSDVRSIAREEAANRAIDRLARNLVDRVVEDW